MRDLADIIEACKLNEKPSVDELRYAVIALASLMNMAVGTLTKIYENEILFDSPLSNKIRVENVRMAYGIALNKSPKEWLGRDNDPENPEYQRFHAMGVKLLEKALKGELPNQRAKESGGNK